MSIRQISNVNALQFFQICRFAGVLVLSIIFVKSSLTQEEVSYIEFFLYLSNLFAFFWSYGFKNSYLSYFPTTDKQTKESFLSTLLLLYIGFAFAAAIVVYVIGKNQLIFTWDLEEIEFVHLASIYLVLNTPTILTEHSYILFEDSKRLIQYALLVFVLPIIVMIIALSIELSVSSVAVGFVVVAFLKFVYLLLFPVRLYSVLDVKLDLIKPYLIFSFPLILQALLGNGVEFIDGYLVQRFFPIETFAIYRYGARELPFVVLFVGSVMTALLPKAVNDLPETLMRAKRETTKLMHVLYPISILLILVSPFIFPLVYDDSFKESAYLFNIYALIITSRILIPQLVMFGKHHNKGLATITCIELILNVGLSLFLMNYWGVRGIAVASVIAFFAAKVMVMIFNYVAYKITPSAYIDLRYYSIYNLGLFISFYISLQY